MHTRTAQIRLSIMVHMARIRPDPVALRRAVGCGNVLLRPSICAIRTRAIATNAAVHEPTVDFPAGIPPLTGTEQVKKVDRREAIKTAKPFSDFLTDTFNRQHDYLRISITERCNLRCLYCMPEEGVPLSPPANMLTTPEIFYLSSLFVSQGVTKIRLTGGEPTVRQDIVPLMQQIGSLRPKGLRELALTTNGISLHRKLDAMVEAGLTGVNLSLDTLDPFQFQIMTRRKGFDAVMRSIDRILEMNKLGANVKLKVNCVVMRGLNEREILPFVELGREKDIEVRFIEYMPFGGNKWSENKMISFQEMLDIIKAKYPGLRPVAGHKNDTSKTYEVPGFVGRVGFITSMTNDFCGSCNRLRITSDGNLKVCLHGNAEVSLRDVLRQGNNGEPIDQEAFERIKQIEMDRHEGRLSDETVLGWGQRERELLQVVGAAVKRKAEKHADLNDLANMENRPMILIDQTTPKSIRHTVWPPAMHRTSTTHLLSAHLLTRTTVRTFLSTTFPPMPPVKVEGNIDIHSETALAELNKTTGMMRTDIIREIAMLKSVLKHGIDKKPLPPSLDEVRQLYGLDGPEFNGYWYRAAETELQRHIGRVSEFTSRRAERMLKTKLTTYAQHLTFLTHADLMQEARDVARQAYVYKKTAPFERHQLIIGDIKRLIGQTVRPRMRKIVLGKIEELEQLMGRIAYRESLEGDGTGAVGEDAVAAERRKGIILSEMEMTKTESVVEETPAPATQIQQIQNERNTQSAVDQIQNQLDAFEQQGSDFLEETRKLQDIRRKKEEILQKKREMLEKMREQEERVQQTYRVVMPKAQPRDRHSVDDILEEALRETKQSAPKTQAAVRAPEHRRVEPTTQPVEGTWFPLTETRAGRSSILSSGVAEKDGGTLIDSIMEKSNANTDPIQNDESATQPSMDVKAIPTSASPDTSASTPLSMPHPRSSPLPSQGTTSLSDALHLKVPPEGFIPIDENLVVTFDGEVKQLQSQVFEMRRRLKQSYPRIDSLPYDVWKSENPYTLQTWLKILVKKWQTREESVEAKVESKDPSVKAVLDMMVRDHDLSNEAAERMAARWVDVFGDKDAKRKVAGGDWGFSLDEARSQGQGVSEVVTTLPVVSDKVRPAVSTVAASAGFSSTRRMYSTSSQPDNDKYNENSNSKTPSSPPSPPSTTTPSLPHLTPSGSAHMVSVSTKPHTTRTAIATGTVYFSSPTPLTLIRSNASKKGDVLGVSRIAGIMAAKKCPDLIPLCHPIALTHVGVELDLFDAPKEGEDGGEGGSGKGKDGGFGGVHVEAKVECTGPTGVEMEALTAVMGAALSVVDMCKAVDKGMWVSDVRVVLKQGGRGGTWKDERWVGSRRGKGDV
ncbi:molybdopterin cofactor biosynthetic [Pyrenophora seminiperda CCB06]|uniref:Molybdopterin cofactor biosynthetic n=1 Tax=Pyrenophora seminiperda CCB06 TaxID=1302712 RepID=A0A3M7MF07_9PLEO|nr:molybdopterin cofactor biosynthetic [Pyrenophora seminiperda CCB06]